MHNPFEIKEIPSEVIHIILKYFRNDLRNLYNISTINTFFQKEVRKFLNFPEGKKILERAYTEFNLSKDRFELTAIQNFFPAPPNICRFYSKPTHIFCFYGALGYFERINFLTQERKKFNYPNKNLCRVTRWVSKGENQKKELFILESEKGKNYISYCFDPESMEILCELTDNNYNYNEEIKLVLPSGKLGTFCVQHINLYSDIIQIRDRDYQIIPEYSSSSTITTFEFKDSSHDSVLAFYKGFSAELIYSPEENILLVIIDIKQSCVEKYALTPAITTIYIWDTRQDARFLGEVTLESPENVFWINNRLICIIGNTLKIHNFEVLPCLLQEENKKSSYERSLL